LDVVPYQKKEKTLPKVFSKEKVKELIGEIMNLKHKLIVELFYSSGLRLQELINLKREDIDFDRNLIHVKKGKGAKDRIKSPLDNLQILKKLYSPFRFFFPFQFSNFFQNLYLLHAKKFLN